MKKVEKKKVTKRIKKFVPEGEVLATITILVYDNGVTFGADNIDHELTMDILRDIVTPDPNRHLMDVKSK